MALKPGPCNAALAPSPSSSVVSSALTERPCRPGPQEECVGPSRYANLRSGAPTVLLSAVHALATWRTSLDAQAHCQRRPPHSFPAVTSVPAPSALLPDAHILPVGSGRPACGGSGSGTAGRTESPCRGEGAPGLAKLRCALREDRSVGHPGGLVFCQCPGGRGEDTRSRRGLGAPQPDPTCALCSRQTPVHGKPQRRLWGTAAGPSAPWEGEGSQRPQRARQTRPPNHQVRSPRLSEHILFSSFLFSTSFSFFFF